MQRLAPLLLSLLAATAAEAATPLRAGVGRVDITPAEPVWMSGYANRKHPSEGVAHPLSAKALALDDGRGTRIVIVTTDIIGLPRAISDEVCARLQKEHSLERSRILLNSSHTHTGPVIDGNLSSMYTLDEQQAAAVKRYTRKLVADLIQVAGAALSDLQPARLAWGSGEAGFAINRREFTPKGVRLGVNPGGAVDRSVPVWKVTAMDGRVRALLFGYACHNTTLTGDFYQLSGDYAGVAQAEVEKAHPGATALFMMLCGGDANPEPRTRLEHAEAHGRALAAEVTRVAAGSLEPVDGRIRAAFLTRPIDLAPHTRADFERMREDKNPYRQRLAASMLKAYDERRPVRSVVYPVQAIRFGRDHAILALGGEVVVGYALRAKKEYPRVKLLVAGYSNDVMCYIPTEQVLREGGYEAVDSMTYYGMPGPFAPGVETAVFDAIRVAMRRVGY